jgi:hypothetical protein
LNQVLVLQVFLVLVQTLLFCYYIVYSKYNYFNYITYTYIYHITYKLNENETNNKTL